MAGEKLKIFFVILTDKHARYVDENTKPVMPGSVPPLYDIPLSQVNRILYKDGPTKHPSGGL